MNTAHSNIAQRAIAIMFG